MGRISMILPFVRRYGQLETDINRKRFIITLPIILLVCTSSLFGQLERRLVAQVSPVEQTFMAPRNINLYTVHNLAHGELHYSIMHTFGNISSGYQDLWGIDNGANIRFSLEYGLSDRTSVGLGRSSMDKIVDLTLRQHFLKQMSDDSIPVSLSFSGGLGINTSRLSLFVSDGYSLADRVNIYGSLLVARKFSESFSMQVAPMVAHFIRTGQELNVEDPVESTYISVGMSIRYKVRPRSAITVQFLPSLSGNSFDGSDRNHNIAFGYDIETGGHVFQLYLTTSQALNDSYLLAGTNGNISDRHIRFGFNINRLFKVRS